MIALLHATLAEQAYEELQAQIAAGRLPAGRPANSRSARRHRLILRRTLTIRSCSLERHDVARSRGAPAAIIATLHGPSAAAAVRAVRDHLTRSRDEMLSRAPEELPPRP